LKLSIIMPTYNEAANIGRMVEVVSSALEASGIDGRRRAETLSFDELLSERYKKIRKLGVFVEK